MMGIIEAESGQLLAFMGPRALLRTALDAGYRRLINQPVFLRSLLEPLQHPCLMHNYADFSICTSDALNFTCQRFKTAISSERQSELLRLYQHLPRFDDVTPALHSLRAAFRLFAFSTVNRTEVTPVLSNPKILAD